MELKLRKYQHLAKFSCVIEVCIFLTITHHQKVNDRQHRFTEVIIEQFDTSCTENERLKLISELTRTTGRVSFSIDLSNL